MVGSVLVQRMCEARDFDLVEPVFFSSSQAGGRGPAIGKDVEAVRDAMDVDALRGLPVIVSCQGGEYTNAVHPKLRSAGWKGYWIDAASALRMNDDAVIILDPVNMQVIEDALARGVVEVRMVLGLLHLFTQPGPAGRILDVGELDADRSTVGLAEAREDLP